MANFTPGPWELIWEDGKHGVIGASTEKKLVAIVGNNPDDDKNDIRKANATLIAAAPDLLAACEAARTVVDSQESREVWRLLSNAIAKAKKGIGTHASTD